MNIDYLPIINVLASSLVIFSILIKLTSNYIEVIGYKKLGKNIQDIYYITSITWEIIASILLFKVFKFSNDINILILYGSITIIFILFIVSTFLLIFKKHKKEKPQKERVNYLKILKKVWNIDRKTTTTNIIKSSYIYVSIILLYYTLINRYNYNYDEIGQVISDTYLFGIFTGYFFYKLISKCLSKRLETLYEKLEKKDDDSDYVSEILNEVIRFSLPIIILLLVISGPLSRILCATKYNLLFNLFLLLPFYIMYDVILKFNIKYSGKKILLFVLLSGLTIKLIFEIPLINAMYRAGYTLVFGSILSTIIGFIFSIISGYFLIKKKLHLHFLKGFEKLLNIIYENIIFCLVLVLFTLIVKPDTGGIIHSLFVIIFYIFVAGIFQIAKFILVKR